MFNDLVKIILASLGTVLSALGALWIKQYFSRKKNKIELTGAEYDYQRKRIIDLEKDNKMLIEKNEKLQVEKEQIKIAALKERDECMKEIEKLNDRCHSLEETVSKLLIKIGLD